MGNVSSMARASTALDSYVAELGNDISYDKSLSSSRFLKSILARHAYGPLVLKIFIKPDSTMSLRFIQRRLKAERDALEDLSCVNPYSAFVETEKAGYLIRQWVGSNLYDRVSTQPYLSLIEKKWIAFQLLTALRDTRARKVTHGDIKSENILILSDLTLVITDFSSAFKPTYLPLDDPSDFSFFFDTSSRRTCYVAPERFYTADSRRAEEKRAASESDEAWGKRDGKIAEEMDVFSAGCVIAEMWTDGRTVFNLSELYAYREGTLGLEGILDNISDVHVKNMISQMLSREPADRPSFDRVLSLYRDTIFPEYFYTFFKDYVSSLSEVPDQGEAAFLQRVSSMPGTKIDRLLEEWDSISIHLETGNNSPALLLLNLVTSSIRNVMWPSSRLHGLQLFLRLLPYLSDEDKVDRVVPFVTDLLSDDIAIVRAEACRTLVSIVATVSSITPQNATFIPEYLLPQMRHLSTDPDVFVRATYAKGLVRIADAAVRMLEMSQAAKAQGKDLEVSGVVEPDYDSMLLEIQQVVEEQATSLLVDPTAAVKRSMLSDIADLCLFFGRQKSSETVLSHIMTYLNDRDWLLRLAFFDGIVGVGAFIGIRAIEEYVLPLMLQALADPEEAVVARVITALTSLSSLRLLPRMRIWDVFFATYGFLCHPNLWIRQGAVGFVASAAKNLPSSDIWCILYPTLRTMLQADIMEMEEDAIMAALVDPLPRAVLTAAKAAALSDSPRGFWNLNASIGNAKAALISAAETKSESGLLKDKGITGPDERKVMALRTFIAKQAHASRGREATELSTPNDAPLDMSKPISLTDLGVTPQTIFISPRTVGVDAKSDLKRLRPYLAEPSSRRTSFTNRSAKAGILADEIRKKSLATETVPSKPEETSNDAIVLGHGSPSESAVSSSFDLAAMSRTGKKRVDTKAAPAVAASHTTVTGTTTAHDDPVSGRGTPIPFTMTSSKELARSYASSYEGQDPGLKAFLEQVDLDNYREPLLDFGPRISANSRRRSSRPKTPNSTAGPGVTMIGHLSQHTGPITAIVTAPDSMFFATASDDGQILIWDSARLERSVATRARLSFNLGSPITAMGRIDHTHCLAAAGVDGQMSILRVYASTSGSAAKYSKIEVVRTWHAGPEEGHVVSIHHLRDSTLIIATSTSVVGLLDIRTMEITRRFQHPLEFGSITAVCPSEHWLVTGTDLGILSLWDLRFGLLLKSWRASRPVTALQLHPSRGRGRWIMVSVQLDNAEPPIVEVYDIESAKLTEVYEIRPSRSSKPSIDTTSEEIPSRSELISEIASREDEVEIEDELPPSVLAMLTGQGSFDEATSSSKSSTAATGWMVTAGEDRAARYWDLVKASDGFVICGSPRDLDVQFKQSSSSSSISEYYTLPVGHRQPNSASAETRHAAINKTQQPLRPHYDAVCALGSVDTPFSSCVITGDRSGVLKVWRLEGVSNRSAA